jgi:TonB family protein
MISSSAASWLFPFALNAVWKVALIYLGAWLTARLVRPLGPRMEQRIWVSALFLELLLPACHLHVDELASQLMALLHRTSMGSPEVRILIGPGSGAGDRLHMPAPLMQISFLVYAGITFFFSTRLAWGLWKTHQLVRSSSTLTLPAGPMTIWTSACQAAQLSAGDVRIAVSPSLRSPMTVGLRSMWLLLPPTFLERAGDGELEAAFAHECAHMRRHDFAKNLFYSIVALPIAFHPLLWRTLAGIAESRELICDDLAAASFPGHNRYARSLVRLAEMLTAGPGMPESGTLHAIGIFDANIFERRIMRLTHPPIQIRGLRRFATLALCALATVAVCGTAMAWRVEINPGTAHGMMHGMMADPPKRIPVKASEMQANLLSQVPPVYPPDAKAAGTQGSVLLDAIIGKEGTIEQLKIQEGPKALQQSALDAVRQWKYRPYLLNGEPIEVETTITVTYSLGK